MPRTESLLLAAIQVAKESNLHSLSVREGEVEISFTRNEEFVPTEMPELSPALSEEKMAELEEKEDREALFFCSGGA